MNRRQFTKNAIVTSGMITAASLSGFPDFSSPAGRSIKKGIMWGSIGVGKTILEKFQLSKEAGFDGIEPMSHMDRKEVLNARDATGLTIPSVCGALHWK